MTGSEINIRLLTANDAGEWLRLRIEALEGDPQAFSASLEEYRALSVEEVRKRLWSSADAFVVGAFDDNRLLGVAGFLRDRGEKSRHKGHVWGVYVTPAARGKSIGRQVMRELLQRGSSIAGIEQIMLSVSSVQAAAVKLYRSLGFEPWGVEPRALRIGDTLIDEEHMVLRLRNAGGGGVTNRIFFGK